MYRSLVIFGAAVLLCAQDITGWHRVGNDREHFDIALDRSVRHGGSASGRLECNLKSTSGAGTLEQDLRPDEYIGKRIRVTAMDQRREDGRGVHVPAGGRPRRRNPRLR